MARLILFFLLVSILYYLLHLLMKGMSSFRKKTSSESEAEELVQDPYCQTYIPKRSALKKKVAGTVYYFCNQECLERYLRKREEE
jgi:uncharacterized protein